MTPPQLTTIAGFQVVRVLATSRRSEIYLGHGSRQVALKVFRADADPASVDRELAALSTAAVHLPELLDVATLPDGRACFVLERLAGASLAGHLAECDTLAPGEAVTILAPLSQALANLHANGFAHTGLSLASIRFGPGGRPVLTGLGALGPLPEPGPDRVAALREDYRRLEQVLSEVFDRTNSTGCFADLGDWFAEAIAATPFLPCLDELERRLFACAQPLPVVFNRAASPDAERALQGVRVRAELRGGSREAERASRADAAGPRHGAGPVGLRWRAFLPAELADLLSRALPDPRLFGQAAQHLAQRVRARRRPVLLGVGLAGALVVVAMNVLPAGAERPAEPTVVPTTPTTAETPRPGAAAETAADSAAVTAEDPVAAAAALLRRRTECLAAASVICLDTVDQSGSAQWAADSYRIRLGHLGATASADLEYDATKASLVERSGDSALVSISARVPAAMGTPGVSAEPGADSKPASLLIIKGEAGWRVREIFDY